mgnify:CR=1 FL=1
MHVSAIVIQLPKLTIFFYQVERKIVILLKIREKFSIISIKHIVAKNFQVF